MESVFKINNFDSLDEHSQQEIQDFISGITSQWQIELFSYCDSCEAESELNRIETEGGIIRVCNNCKLKFLKNESE